jgi:hypothetical protein
MLQQRVFIDWGQHTVKVRLLQQVHIQTFDLSLITTTPYLGEWVLQQRLFIDWEQNTVKVRLLQQVHSHVSHVAVAERCGVALLGWREEFKAAEACQTMGEGMQDMQIVKPMQQHAAFNCLVLQALKEEHARR